MVRHTPMCNIKQQNEQFCAAKNSWKPMRPKARPIQLNNGRAQFYGKNKVDRNIN